MNRNTFFKTAKITTPVFFGYIAIGIPFGLMLVNANYPWWFAVVISLTMYAGAGQYVAVGLFASGASLGTIAVTELMVNIRHIVYGLSLITKFRDTGKWKPYLIFALTDETYALMTSCDVPEGVNAGEFYGVIAALNQFYWVLGSLIGAVAGTLIPFSFEGIDFALTALFAVLLIEQINKSKDFVPPAIGIGSTIIAIVLERFGILKDENILITALALGIAVIIMLRGKSSSEKKIDKTEVQK